MADVPKEQAWLSSSEANHLNMMRFPGRRADWLLGRWTAKNAVAVFLDVTAEPHALRDIEIRPALSGAPEVFFKNELAALAISISHRAGVGACALAPSGALLGCDLETIEPHGDAFATDYFTADEQALVAEAGTADRLRLLALLWSSKESALKAMREGLRLDTRQVTVSFPGGPKIQSANPENLAQRSYVSVQASPQRIGWSPLQVRRTDDQIFRGWWSQTGDLLRTVLAAPPPGPPILLGQECSLSC